MRRHYGAPRGHEDCPYETCTRAGGGGDRAGAARDRRRRGGAGAARRDHRAAGAAGADRAAPHRHRRAAPDRPVPHRPVGPRGGRPGADGPGLVPGPRRAPVPARAVGVPGVRRARQPARLRRRAAPHPRPHRRARRCPGAGPSCSTRPVSASSGPPAPPSWRNSPATGTSSSPSTTPTTRRSWSSPTDGSRPAPCHRRPASRGRRTGSSPRRSPCGSPTPGSSWTGWPARTVRCRTACGRPWTSAGIGMIGHSLGGTTAAETMFVDRRVKAGANLDGAMSGGVLTGGLDRPFLLVGSDAHGRAPTRPGPRSGPSLRGPRHELELRDSGHMSFTDYQVLLPQAGIPPADLVDALRHDRGRPVGAGAARLPARVRRPVSRRAPRRPARRARPRRTPRCGSSRDAGDPGARAAPPLRHASRRSATSPSTSSAASCSRCSARTAPGRPRPSNWSRAWTGRPPAPSGSSATTPSATGPMVRPRTGVMLQEGGFPPDLTPAEALRMWAGTLPPCRPPGRRGPRPRRPRHTGPACGSGSCPAANGAASTSPPPSSAGPTCSSSTSRPPAWTRRAGTTPGGCCARCSPTASPSCSAPTTCRRRRSSPTGVAILHGGAVVATGSVAEVVAGFPARIAFDLPPGPDPGRAAGRRRRVLRGRRAGHRTHPGPAGGAHHAARLGRRARTSPSTAWTPAPRPWTRRSCRSPGGAS